MIDRQSEKKKWGEIICEGDFWFFVGPVSSKYFFNLYTFAHYTFL
jgi:hypothetical protein